MQPHLCLLSKVARGSYSTFISAKVKAESEKMLGKMVSNTWEAFGYTYENTVYFCEEAINLCYQIHNWVEIRAGRKKKRKIQNCFNTLYVMGVVLSTIKLLFIIKSLQP